MIDWGSLAANSLWVLGCALGLAVFSYASWQASRSGSKLNNQLRRTQAQIGFCLAGVLFSAGLALTGSNRLVQIVWAVMGVYFLNRLGRNLQTARSVEKAE